MHIPNYLSLSRHNVFYFRFPIPRVFHPERKQSHVRLSLKTSNEREALYTANMLAYHVKRMLNELNGTAMDYVEIRNTIKQRLSEFVDEGREERLNDGPYDKNKRGSLELLLGRYQKYDTNDYYEGDIDANNASRKVEELFPGLGLREAQRTDFIKEFMRQYPEALEALLAFNDDPQDITFLNEVGGKAGTQTPLHEAIAKYTAEKIRAENWRLRTQGERKTHFTMLTDILGADFVTERLNKKEAVAVKDILLKIPKNWKKDRKTRDLSIHQATEVEGLDKMATRTVNLYLNAYKEFGEWLKNSGYLSENCFAGLELKLKKNKGKDRDAFSLEDTQTLLSELQSPKIKGNKQPHQYWGTMIVAYTGMRLNEAAQLHIDDITEKSGVWCFDVNDNAETKHLKTVNSARIIPIHSKLIEDGFLEYVDQLKEAKQDRLFPKLKYTKEHHYGRNLSRWFNEKYLVQLGLKSTKLTFHSLRHTVGTCLSEAGVQDPVVRKILGHTQNDIFNLSYNHNERIEEMKEAIEKLPY